MLGIYLNQTAEYKACTGTDNRGQPIYAEPQTIRCRKQVKTQQVLAATQQVITANHVYYTQNSIDLSDKLDGLVVLAISEWTGLNGEIIGYKAVL